MKIQPFHASDGEYVTLVEFVAEVALLLEKSFRPAKNWSDTITESIPNQSDTFRFFYGEDPFTIQVLYKKSYEPRSHGHIEDDVFVACRGLPEGQSIELHTLRHHQDSRFIEIHVKGPEVAVGKILERFEKRFRINHMANETELMSTLRAARAGVAVHAWRAVELNAQQVLRYDPYNAEATMYLGIARAAQGFEPEGENLLLASITLNPKNQYAFYNLGLIALQQGRCLFASDAFRHGLIIDPENHPLLFQFGRALEKLGMVSEAFESYQRALLHSPNPDQDWEFTGMDFTEESRNAIARLHDASNNKSPKNGELNCSD